jgi:hypothetical protein
MVSTFKGLPTPSQELRIRIEKKDYFTRDSIEKKNMDAQDQFKIFF